MALSNWPGLIGDFVARPHVGICGYWGDAAVSGQFILDHQLVGLGHIGEAETLRKAVGVAAGLQHQREVLHYRRRLPGVEIAFKLLHLGVLCGKPRLDFADRALMVGLSGGEAQLPLGLPLVTGSDVSLVGDAALVPFGKVLFAGTGQTSTQACRLRRPEPIGTWRWLWVRERPWREDRQRRGFFQGLEVEEVVDRKCVGQ